MKALVLGAAGFLGSNLVRALLAHGQQVRALVRPTSNTRVLDGLDTERVLGDLRDPDSLARACAGVRSEEHTSELHHLVISYAVFCLKKKKKTTTARSTRRRTESVMDYRR